MTAKCSDETIAQRVQEVRGRMEAAAAKSGRKAEDIVLVGVTKTQPAEAVRALLACGIETIGENKVQELLEKEPHLSDLPHKTHLIGHLQRNKAKFLPGHIDMMQSVDSVKIVSALEKAFQDTKNSPLDVLIEVNIGREESKAGAMPDQLDELVELVNNSKSLCLRGLMAIPPLCKGDTVRHYFEQMYHLFIDIRDKKGDNKAVSILSMGMSSDYESAILEGATMVRLGTVLFGVRSH